jgi:hypothetical protein
VYVRNLCLNLISQDSSVVLIYFGNVLKIKCRTVWVSEYYLTFYKSLNTVVDLKSNFLYVSCTYSTADVATVR